MSQEVRTKKKRQSLLSTVAVLAPIAVLMCALICGGIAFKSQKPIDYCQVTNPMSEETSSYTWDISFIPFGVECLYEDRASGESTSHFKDWGTPFFVAGMISALISVIAIVFLVIRHNRRAYDGLSDEN